MVQVDVPESHMKAGKGLHHVEFTCEVAAYAGGIAPSTEIAARLRRDNAIALPMKAGLLSDGNKFYTVSMRALPISEKVSEPISMNFKFMFRFSRVFE
jgi:hypothetical protein